MSEFISSELRSAIWIRAANCCEYCLTHADDSYYPHEIDHILPKKHGGSSNYDNLALSCFFCNRYKGSDIGSIDPLLKKFTKFFNPRSQKWDDHFSLEGNKIIGISPPGRVTTLILRLNHQRRLTERQFLMKIGRYPCMPKISFL